MKKISIVLLCSISLKVLTGAESVPLTVEPLQQGRPDDRVQFVPRKTGYHAPSPEVLRATQKIVKQSQPLPVISKAAERSTAKAAAHAAANAPEKPKKPQITQIANINSWPASLVYDQESLESCAANAMGFIIRYLTVRNSKTPTKFSPNRQRLDISRLYQYYNTRFYEGVLFGNVEEGIAEDGGASIAMSILALDKFGCTPETFSDLLETVFGGDYKYVGHPYSVNNFATQPSPEAYRRAFDPDYDGLNPGMAMSPPDSRVNLYATVSKSIKYADLVPSKYRNLSRALTTGEMSAIVSRFVSALSSNQPIFFGAAIDSSFFKDENGFIPTPNLQTFSSIGGHAVVLVGYGQYNPAALDKKYFKFINSWGSGWGQNGFGFLEEDYVANVNVFLSEAYAIDLPK